jgi:hypothetical protein
MLRRLRISSGVRSASISEIDAICALHVSAEATDQWGMFAIPISRCIDGGVAEGFALSAADGHGSSCRAVVAAIQLI